ncbi:hypothetical protein KC324_g14 [Hortaea werneckii]|nr:hypothetical protein KC324_g14 [Hortaea werneckii]
MTSIADARVLAVYIPPHAPLPGHAGIDRTLGRQTQCPTSRSLAERRSQAQWYHPVPHALGAHTHTIANTDCVELHAHQAGILYALLDRMVEIQKVHVARVTTEPDRRNAYLGLLKVGLVKPSGIELGLRSSLGNRLRDRRRDLVETFIAGVEGRSAASGGGLGESSSGRSSVAFHA